MKKNKLQIRVLKNFQLIAKFNGKKIVKILSDDPGALCCRLTYGRILIGPLTPSLFPPGSRLLVWTLSKEGIWEGNERAHW